MIHCRVLLISLVGGMALILAVLVFRRGG